MLADAEIEPKIEDAGAFVAGDSHEVNVEIRQIDDAALIRATMTAPRMAITCPDGVTLDETADRYLNDPTTVFLGLYDGDEFLGIFLYHMVERLISVHSYLLPAGMGAKGLESARAAIKWVWDRVDSDQMCAVVPSCNTLSLQFAKRLGFKEDARFCDRWQYKGQTCDVLVMGLKRGVK